MEFDETWKNRPNIRFMVDFWGPEAAGGHSRPKRNFFKNFKPWPVHWNFFSLARVYFKSATVLRHAFDLEECELLLVPDGVEKVLACLKPVNIFGHRPDLSPTY